MRWTVLAALLVIGCGGGGESGSPVDGNWIVTAGSCAGGMTFGDGRYAQLLICPDAASTALDLQEENGTFRVQAGVIVYTVERTTCPATVTPVYNTPYSVASSTLTLTYTDGAVIFERNLASGGSAVTTFGCFQNGTFTPGPLVTL